MLIELRASDDRLRGPKAVDAAPILTSAFKAVADSPADLARTRVICDWIQYKHNFREPVEVRLVEPWAIEPGKPETDGETYELAIDLRRAKAESIGEAITSALE